MNKIYKVIWSKVRQCNVVVSELASSHSDGTVASRVRGRKGSIGLLSFLVLMHFSALSLGGHALAADTIRASYTTIATGNNEASIKYSIYLNPAYDGYLSQGIWTGTEFQAKPTSATAGINSVVLGYGSKSGFKKSVTIGALARNASTDGTGVPDEFSGSVSIGYKASNGGYSSVVIGDFASNVTSYQETQADTSRQAPVVPTYKSTSTVVIGTQSAFSDNPFGLLPEANDSAGQGVAVGSRAITTTQATALGNDVYAVGRSSIAIGSDDISSYTEPITKTDYYDFFRGLYKKIDPMGAKYGFKYRKEDDDPSKRTDDPANDPPNAALTRIYSPTLAQGDGSIAIGSRSVSFKAGSTSLGTLAFALEKGSTAVGTLSRAQGEGAIALGSKTSVFAPNSVATGNSIQILANGGMGYGYKAYSGGENSIAIGSNVYANTMMDLGTTYTPAGGDTYHVFQSHGGHSGLLFSDLEANAVIAANQGEHVQFNDHTSYLAVNNASEQNYLSLLENALKGDGVIKAKTRTLHGVENVVQTDGKNAVVVGSDSIGLGNNAVALGHGAIALNDNDFALGSFSFANSDNAMAIGLTSRALGQNSVALGVGTSVAENANNSIAIGTGAVNYGTRSTLLGNSSRIYNGDKSIAFGYDTRLSGMSNVALGNDITILSTAVYDDTKSEESNAALGSNVALGNHVIIGDGTTQSVAIGTNARIGSASKKQNIAHALALGYNAWVYARENPVESGNDAAAIGSNAEAWLNNSIALGTDSKTDYTVKDVETLPWKLQNAIAIPTKVSTGVVSVGYKGGERRIVNVASGALDTDAVNVGQLRMISERISTDIKDVKKDSTSHYFSVEASNGNSLGSKLNAKIEKDANFKEYVKLKYHLLTYEARRILNGEQFNPETLKIMRDRMNALAAGDESFVTSAPLLNNIKIPAPSGNAIVDEANYDRVLKQIQDAYDAEKDQAVSPYTKEQIAQFKEDGNYDNKGAKGINSIAVGYGAKTSDAATDAIALGVNPRTDSAGAISLGYQANVNGQSDNSVSVGTKAHVGVKAPSSVILGNETNSFAAESVVIGSKARSGTEQVGTVDASSGAAKGIALGAESAVSDKNLSVDGLAFGQAYSDANPDVYRAASNASVGAGAKTRRLTNVAAGHDDTDLVNVAQLRSLASNGIVIAGDNGSSTASMTLGNSTNLDANRMTFNITGGSDIVAKATGNDVNLSLKKGEVTATSQSPVSGDTVYKALQAAKTVVKAADDGFLAVTSKEENGGTTFTVDLNKPVLQEELGKTFALVNGNNAEPVNSWLTALSTYTKGQTESAVNGAKMSVSPADESRVVVTPSGDGPVDYKIDLASDLAAKLGNIPDDLTEALKGKVNSEDVTNAIKTLQDKGKEQLSPDLTDDELGPDGKKVIKNWAAQGVAVKSKDNKLTVTPSTDNSTGEKTYTVSVNEENFNGTTLKNLLGGVSTAIDTNTTKEDPSLITEGAVATYGKTVARELASAGFQVNANQGGPDTVQLGKKVSLEGKANEIGGRLESDQADGAKLTIALLDTVKNKIDNAVSKTGDNLGEHKDEFLKALGVDPTTLDGKYVKVDGSNFTPETAKAFRTSIEAMSKDEVDAALLKAKSIVAAKAGSGLSVETKAATDTEPTSYTVGFAQDLNGKLDAVPTNVKDSLNHKANASELDKLADVDLHLLNPAGPQNLAKEAVKAVVVSADTAEKAVKVGKTVAQDGTTAAYNLSFSADQLDKDAVKKLVGGVSDTIPPKGENPNTELVTANAVNKYVNDLIKLGFKLGSNAGTAPTVQLAKTATVKGDGTYLTGTTTANDGNATVTIGLGDSYTQKLDKTPDNTKAELQDKVDKKNPELTAEAEATLKSWAGEAVKVAAAADNKLTVSATTANGSTTYKVDVNEDNFSKDAIKSLVGGVAESMPEEGTNTVSSTAVTTVGAVNKALSDLRDKGLVIKGNDGSQVTALGKTVSVKGDGTYLATTAEANGAEGAKVTLALTAEKQALMSKFVKKDGSDLADNPEAKKALQEALGVDKLNEKYAAVDASNIGSNDGAWREALQVSSTDEMNKAIKAATIDVVGDNATTAVKSSKIRGGATTFTVGLTDALNQRFDDLSRRADQSIGGKASKDLSDIGTDGKNKIKTLTQSAVVVTNGDDSVKVTKEANSADGSVTYKVAVDSEHLNKDKVKDLAGGVTNTVPDDTTSSDSGKDKLPTVQAVNKYVTDKLDAVGDAGFKVASNGVDVVTNKLGKVLTIKGGEDGEVVGTASANAITLKLGDTVKQSIDDREQTADFKIAKDIDRNKWVGALGLNDLPLHYKANGADDSTTTLSAGLNFVNDDSITVGNAADGVVHVDTKSTLTGITSIANNAGTTMSLTSDGLDMGGKTLSGLLPGVKEDPTSIVTVRQLQRTLSDLTGSSSGGGDGIRFKPLPDPNLNKTGNAGNVEGQVAQLNTLLNGMSGNIVYTDAEGGRLYYDAKDQKIKKLLSGDVVDPKDIILSTVSPTDGSTTTPVAMNNVDSALNIPATGRPITEEEAHTVIAGAANDGNGGLLAKSDVDLKRVTSLADLQALAMAGQDFVANSDSAGSAANEANVLHSPLGSRVFIKGKESNVNGTAFTTKNMVTYLDGDTSTIRLAMASTPNFDSVQVGGENGTVIGPDATGTKLVFSGLPKDENGKAKPVVLRGIKEGGDDSLANAGDLKSIKNSLGERGAAGDIGTTGPAGVDGLSKASITEQIEAQRAGTSGNMIYTDENGKRLVKVGDDYYVAQPGMVQGSDGKWYASADDLDDATGLPKAGKKALKFQSPIKDLSKVFITAVNGTGDTTAPVALSNIKSAMGLTGAAALTTAQAQGAVSNLLDAKGADVNKATTLGDLQALSLAGLDFKATEASTGVEADKTVHANLSDTVKIVGGATSSEGTSADNLITVAEGQTPSLTIKMKKEPNFTSVKLGTAPDDIRLKATDMGLQLGEGENMKAVVLTGLAPSNNGTAAVTRGEYKTALSQLGVARPGATGAEGAKGVGGKDGLNGKNLSAQIQGLRDGLAGTMVYTEADGSRLVLKDGKFYPALIKGTDGKWYKSEDVDGDKHPKRGAVARDPQQLAAVDPEHVQLSAISPDGTTTKSVSLKNVMAAIDRGTDPLTAKKARELIAGKNGLLTANGPELNRAVTVSDLQVLGQAGLNLVANSKKDGTADDKGIDLALGSDVAIKGTSDPNAVFKSDIYSSDNVITYTEIKDDHSDTGINIAIKKSPSFDAIKLGSGNNAITVTNTEQGELSLSRAAQSTTTGGGDTSSNLRDDISSPRAADTNVVLKGVASSNAPDSVLTLGDVKAVKEDLGLIAPTGDTGAKGPRGADGQEGKSVTTKIEAQRQGRTGTMVYTDLAGARIEDPTIAPVRISAVNPYADTAAAQTTEPMTVSNIASGLGYAPKATDDDLARQAAAKKAVQGDATTNTPALTARTGASLAAAATTADLQALALNGYDFNSNQPDSTIHRNLGQGLSIVGAASNTTADDFSGENVLTTSTPTQSTITVKVATTPRFEGLKLAPDTAGAKPTTIVPNSTGDALTFTNDGKPVNIKGLAKSSNASGLATQGEVNDLKRSLGLLGAAGAAGSDGQVQPGPAGKDGLDAMSVIDQVQALRDGMAGSMVYTTEQGERVTRKGDHYYKTADVAGKVQGKDGLWYPAGSLDAEGNAKPGIAGVEVNALGPNTPLIISAVDGRTGETTTATSLGNVASALGLADNPTAAITAEAAKQAIQGTDDNTGLIHAKGASLQRVVTVGDLQALAQAGFDFTPNAGGTKDTVHRTLGSQVTIQGAADGVYDSDTYDTKNLVTFNDVEDSANPALRVAFSKNPEFDSINLKKDDKTVTLTPTDNGTSLTVGDGKTPSGPVAITGIKSDGSPDSLATKGDVDEVKEVLGIKGRDGNPGAVGETGDAGAPGADSHAHGGADGLEAASVISKIQAQRDGTSGIVVYTDDEGHRLTKIGNEYYYRTDGLAQAGDGKWYKEEKVKTDGSVEDGAQAHDFSKDHPVDKSKIRLAVVNADGSTTKPMTVRNLPSALGLDGSQALTTEAARTAVGKLLTATGRGLNDVVTVADLQAVAKAGLAVKGTYKSDGGAADAIDVEAGGTFTIAANGQADGEYSAGNIKTVGDSNAKSITVTMRKAPEFDGLNLGTATAGVSIAPKNGGDGIKLTKVGGTDDKVVLSGLKEGSSPSSIATVGSLKEVRAALGLDSANGANGATGGAGQNAPAGHGPAGKDGLDGKGINAKVDAIRNGTAGSMVYTDEEGNRLARFGDKLYKASDVGDKIYKDGKWYDTAEDLRNNHESAAAPQALADDKKVVISAVNGQTGETTEPVGLRFVGSALDLSGKSDNGESTASSLNNPQPLTAKAAGDVMNALIAKDAKDLTKAANGQDLQALVASGFTVSANKNQGQLNNTDNRVQLALGSTLSIKGDDATLFDDKVSSDNVATKLDGNTVRIGLKKKPVFEELKLGPSTATVALKAAPADGTLTLKAESVPPVGAQAAPSTDVELRGVEAGTTPDSLVNLGQVNDLKHILGVPTGAAPAPKKSPTDSPEGKDGLDGRGLLATINALRNGEAGPVVYTDGEGNRLVRQGGKFYKASDLSAYAQGNDGKWYDKTKVDDNGTVAEGATAVNLADVATAVEQGVQLSAVDAKGSTTAPMTMANVASGLGLTGNKDNSLDITGEADRAPAALTAAAAKAASQALLTKSGVALSRVATVGDLQALAQGGLDVTSNADTKANSVNKTHITLGQGINLIGADLGESYNKGDYDSDNLATFVDKATSTVQIAMKKTPAFKGVTLGDGDKAVGLTVDDQGRLKLSTGENGDQAVTITGVKDGSSPDSAATKKTTSELRNIVGLKGATGAQGDQGAVGQTGPAGKDGLDGATLATKVNAQRDGLSGNMVYTDDEGNRLIKVGDSFYKASDVPGDVRRGANGQWYKADQLKEDGSLKDSQTASFDFATAGLSKVPTDKIIISALNPDSGLATDAVVIGNLKPQVVADNTTTPQAAVAGTNGAGGLLQQTTDLDKMASLGDVKVLAQAGTTFKTNERTSHAIGENEFVTPVGAGVKILGAADGVYSDEDYSADNLVTAAERDGKTIRVAMAKSPAFSALSFAADGAPAEAAITLTPEVGADGKIGLRAKNGMSDAVDQKVVIRGVAASDDKQSALTVAQLNEKIARPLGDLLDRTDDGRFSPKKDDGLNGKTLGTKLAAQRDGILGNMVYTDGEGNRLVNIKGKYYLAKDLDGKLVQANDGQWYKAGTVQDGLPKAVNGRLPAPVAPEELGINSRTEDQGIFISAVHPFDKPNSPGSTKVPTVVGNVASGLKLPGTYEANDGGAVHSPVAITPKAALEAIQGNGADKPGLLKTAGKDLTRASTVGDLQALSLAGLRFTTSDLPTDGFNAPLASTINVRGADYSASDRAKDGFAAKFSTDNLYAALDKNMANTIVLSMAKSPSFDSIKLGKNGAVEISAGDKGLLVKTGNQAPQPIATGDSFINVVTDKGNYKVKLGETIALTNDGDPNITVTRVLRPGATAPGESSTSAQNPPASGGSTNPTTGGVEGGAITTAPSGNAGGNVVQGGTTTAVNTPAGGATGGNAQGGTVAGGTATGSTAAPIADTREVPYGVALKMTANPSFETLKSKMPTADDEAATKGYYDAVVKNAVEETQSIVPEISRQVNDLSKQASTGTASALAAASVPNVLNTAGNQLLGVGVGSYHGESAMSLGYSSTNGDRDRLYRVAGTVNSRGSYSLSLGLGFSFGPSDSYRKGRPIPPSAFHEELDKLEQDFNTLQNLKTEHDKLSSELSVLKAFVYNRLKEKQEAQASGEGQSEN